MERHCVRVGVKPRAAHHPLVVAQPNDRIGRYLLLLLLLCVVLAVVNVGVVWTAKDVIETSHYGAIIDLGRKGSTRSQWHRVVKKRRHPPTVRGGYLSVTKGIRSNLDG